MNSVSGIWWTSIRGGTTSRGYLHETLIGKIEDNKPEADIYDYESKTHGLRTKTFRPLTINFGIEQHLRDAFGTVSKTKGIKCLNRMLRCGKPANWNGNVIEMDLDSDALTLSVNGEVWSALTREKIAKHWGKLTNLVMTPGEDRMYQGRLQHRYHPSTYYQGLVMDRVFDELGAGKIAVEFRVREDDKGTAWRLPIAQIKNVFQTVVVSEPTISSKVLKSSSVAVSPSLGRNIILPSMASSSDPA